MTNKKLILDRTAGNEKPTETLMSNEFQVAYDFFNKQLFGDLPQCMLTLDTAKQSAWGYFQPESYISKDGQLIHQIALNPSYLLKYSLEENLQTIVHEQVHLWVHDILGKKTKGGYHCKKWVAKMEDVGLIPSHTGKLGGKKTGYRMSDYIQVGGRFEKACNELISSGFCLSWASADKRTKPQIYGTNSNKGKVKFICPTCTNTCWAASSRNLVCGDHMTRMTKSIPSN